MLKRTRAGTLFSAGLIGFCIAVFGVAVPVSASAQDAVGTLEDNLQDQINSLSGEFSRPAERDALASFYAGRQHRPVWVDESGPTRAARSVIAELARAEDWGLDLSGLKLKSVFVPLKQGRWTTAEAGAAEYEISAAILSYARQARGGRIADPARTLSSYLDRRPVMPDPAGILSQITTAAEPDSVLRSFHPPHEQFRKLQVVYQSLRATHKEADAAARMPETGPPLLPGKRHADIANLRRRLAVPASSEDTELYDDALKEAVKKFQDAEYLRPDGIIGLKTRKALNAGAEDKLKSIRANMEQWRWMPHDLGKTHLFVNLPAFTIQLVQDGAVTLEERVIVGKSATQTPVFSRNLTSVVLKPSWQLPESIKLEKLIDAQRRGSSIEDEGYLIKKGEKAIESWKVDWSKADLTAYTFFQPSGDGNALGKVKFLFPNKHSVYLHDTPKKSLFDTSERLYSHGCVRLRNPLAFAQRLLDIAQVERSFDVKAAVDDGPGNNQVTLENPIPIHLGYFTVWINENGQAEYLGDPYGHEERIALALENKWDEIDKDGDHLAAVDTQELKTVRLESPDKPTARPTRVAKSVASPPQIKRRFAPAMGVTKVIYFPKPKPQRVDAAPRAHRVTAGDLMRRAFGH
jgi:L,D-transpeptidase YcbB